MTVLRPCDVATKEEVEALSAWLAFCYAGFAGAPLLITDICWKWFTKRQKLRWLEVGYRVYQRFGVPVDDGFFEYMTYLESPLRRHRWRKPGDTA